MNGLRANMIGAAGGALAAMLAAAPALALVEGACDDEKKVVIHRHDGGKVTSKNVVLELDDGEVHTFSDSKTIQVIIEDGEPKVIIDGKEIPADQIQKKGGQIFIVDEDGKKIETIGAGPFEGHVGTFDLEFGDFDDKFITVKPGEFAWMGREHPKVMMGVTLDVPGPALEYHLRLDSGEATLIRGVQEDLPADEAGLVQFDIVVAVDGETPADPESLREALADKEPGDIVELTIIHRGKKKEVEVELDEFDAEVMISSTISGDFALPFGVGRQFEVFESPTIRFFGEAPNLRDIVIDGDRRFFEVAPELKLKMHNRWIEEGEEVEFEDDEEDLEKRLKSLNKRLAELEKLLNELLREADRD